MRRTRLATLLPRILKVGSSVFLRYYHDLAALLLDLADLAVGDVAFPLLAVREVAFNVAPVSPAYPHLAGSAGMFDDYAGFSVCGNGK